MKKIEFSLDKLDKLMYSTTSMPSIAISFDTSMTNEISPCINCPFASSICELQCCGIGYCKTCCIVDRQCIKCNKTILKKLIKQKEKERSQTKRTLKRKRDQYEPPQPPQSAKVEYEREVYISRPLVRGQFYYG